MPIYFASLIDPRWRKHIYIQSLVSFLSFVLISHIINCHLTQDEEEKKNVRSYNCAKELLLHNFFSYLRPTYIIPR